MDLDARWKRATLLFDQGRWDMAIAELRGFLTQAPDHAPAHALLAYALAQHDELDAALQSAQQAVTVDPELDFAFGALATVLLLRGDHEAAAAAIRRAIELDPNEVDHHSTLAQILLAQKRWNEALASADTGLQLEPQDTNCLNLRSLALTRLGRGGEATDAVDASLAHDPDNPYTHQARGFALLHRGDAKGALHHFQEALRRDPTLDGARAGLVEALKARNPLYRVVLSWFLWLERFSGPRQVQIMIGLWLAARVGSGMLREARHTTAAGIVSFSWLGFVLLMSCAVPLFNLLLLVHPIGRHALERRARRDAILLGLCVLAGVGVGLHAWFGDASWSESGWSFWLLFLLPVAGVGLFHPGWGRRTLQGFCAATFAFWVWWCTRLQVLVADVNAQATNHMSQGELEQRFGHLLVPIREHTSLYPDLLMAIALSTWFVLLAPKGRPRRRRA